MKIKILLLIICVSALKLSAQVGIGNVVPDGNSILDLTNTNNRGLVLPSAPGTFPTSPNGIMFWNATDNTIVYREATGYNSLSPWRFKFGGSVSNNTYFELGNVGIGENDPQVKLHVTGNGRAIVLEGTSTSYLSFRPVGYNNDGGDIGFVNNSTTLTIENERQGDVEVRMNASGGVRNFDVTNGNVQQRGADLVPAGTIVMYFSSSAPSGWALCNGSTYTRSDGTGSIQAPDLRGKFIVAAGSGYSQGSTGGDNDIQITSAHLPEHEHTFSASTGTGGSHRHKLHWSDRSSGGSPSGAILQLDNPNVDADGFTYTNNGSTDGSHSHNVSGTTSSSGNSSLPNIDNRPEYYAVTFIMKL